MNNLKNKFKKGAYPTEEDFATLIDAIGNAGKDVLAKVNEINSRTAHIEQMLDIREADHITYRTISSIYMFGRGNGILILNVAGDMPKSVTQTLLKDGKVLYRYNIKIIGTEVTDSSYWSEWEEITSGSTDVNIKWSTSLNLNDYKSQGVYYIGGERLLSEYDNLPIANAASGHSISAQLTILDASLSQEEQCITQYLKLSNRLGSEGKEYVRTYNRYKDGTESWCVWKELKQTAILNQISDWELKNYTENGIYEGAILNNNDLTYLDDTIRRFTSQILDGGAYELPSGTLFSMEILNNYAIVEYAQSFGMYLRKSITQRAKILLISGAYIEVQRTKVFDGDWDLWKLINT